VLAAVSEVFELNELLVSTDCEIVEGAETVTGTGAGPGAGDAATATGFAGEGAGISFAGVAGAAVLTDLVSLAIIADADSERVAGRVGDGSATTGFDGVTAPCMAATRAEGEAERKPPGEARTPGEPDATGAPSSLWCATSSPPPKRLFWV